MEIVRKYEELPQNIKNKLKKANVYYTNNYEEYIKKSGHDLIYVFTEMLIIPIIIYNKAGIKYAMYACEYYEFQKECSLEEKRLFLDNLQELLRKREKIAWIATTAAAFFDTFPTNSLRIPFGSHVIDLELDMEKLWSNVHTKHRNVIRKAEKSDVIVRSGGMELLDDYCELDKATWHRSGKKDYGKKFFEDILTNMKDNAIIFMAYKGNVPQAGACYLLNDQMCYYMYGASADHPETGSTNYMHWRVIEHMKKLGIKKYSFVGCRIREDENSKYHTIQRFKERFGGTIVQGYMFRTILIPWKYKVFNWMYYAKNHCKLASAIDEEIDKWPELNGRSK